MLSAILAATLSAATAAPPIPPPPPQPVRQFSWPICGPKATGFGYRVDPFTKRVAFHSGLDFPAPEGTPIRASASGRVIAAERRGPYGNMVEIDHGDGYRTRYGHLARFNVSDGEVVQRGQVIGHVGATGRVTGPQLHFEIWYRDVVRDPRTLLNADPACTAR